MWNPNIILDAELLREHDNVSKVSKQNPTPHFRKYCKFLNAFVKALKSKTSSFTDIPECIN